MFNIEKRIGVKLHVIKMRGYERTHWYDETSLLWVSPSPNLRTLAEAILYPGVAMVESTNVSVGRGTTTPFELLGAPWINGEELASYLSNRNIQGVRFMPVEFTPNSSCFKNQLCRGVQILLLIDRSWILQPLGLKSPACFTGFVPGASRLTRHWNLLVHVRFCRPLRTVRTPPPLCRTGGILWSSSASSGRNIYSINSHLGTNKMKDFELSLQKRGFFY